MPKTFKVDPAQIDQALAKTQGKVERVEVKEFPGSTLYVPAGGAPHAGVVFLHGSEGGDAGFADLRAIRWAEAGFAVLAYDYFGGPGTPQKLAGIDIGKTIEAIHWLKTSPYSRGKKVGLYGGSRGAEQALLIASLLKETDIVSAVGAHAPFATTEGPFDPEAWAAGRGPPLGYAEPAWRMGGTPVQTGWPIEIEAFEGPVFISHGTKDELSGVEETKRLEARMRAAKKGDVEVRYLEGEGHIPRSEASEKNDAATLDFFRRSLA